MQLDLTTPGVLKQLSKQIKNEIDTFCADKYDEGPRSHLGASKIGESCSRALWYGFRWIAHKHHDGRQQRLFQRGHFEEPRFCGYLEGVGFNVTLFAEDHLDDAADLDKGKRQIRVSDCKGHFGGSIDGIGEREDVGKLLLEFKTKGTGKGFVELCTNGVRLKANVHYSQMCVYGYKLGLKYAIYMVVCKNDDDLHVEVVPLDWNLAKSLLEKAEYIIFTDIPPSKVSESAAFYECSWCDFKGICHLNAELLVNCRSCRMAKPVDEGAWFCEHWQSIIPGKEAILAACPNWLSII